MPQNKGTAGEAIIGIDIVVMVVQFGTLPIFDDQGFAAHPFEIADGIVDKARATATRLLPSADRAKKGKEIAEKVFAFQVLIDQPEKDQPEKEVLPGVKKGPSKDILKVAHELDLDEVKGHPKSQLAAIEVVEGEILLKNNDLEEGKVPDVRGMGATDAIYILESAGLRVKIQGIGKVKQQSLSPGANCIPGQTVYLTLS